MGTTRINGKGEDDISIAVRLACPIHRFAWVKAGEGASSFLPEEDPLPPLPQICGKFTPKQAPSESAAVVCGTSHRAHLVKHRSHRVNPRAGACLLDRILDVPILVYCVDSRCSMIASFFDGVHLPSGCAGYFLLCVSANYRDLNTFQDIMRDTPPTPSLWDSLRLVPLYGCSFAICGISSLQCCFFTSLQ